MNSSDGFNLSYIGTTCGLMYDTLSVEKSSPERHEKKDNIANVAC